MSLPWSPSEDERLMGMMGYYYGCTTNIPDYPQHPQLQSWHAVARNMTYCYHHKRQLPPRHYTLDVVIDRWNNHLKPLLLLHSVNRLGQHINGNIRIAGLHEQAFDDLIQQLEDEILAYGGEVLTVQGGESSGSQGGEFSGIRRGESSRSQTTKPAEDGKLKGQEFCEKFYIL